MLPVPDSLKRLPWRMLFALFAVVMIGIATLYSAAGGHMEPWALAHGIRFTLLLGVMLAISFVKIETLMDIAYPAYAIALVLLLITEIFGQIGMGAQRWIDLGVIRLQPSELMKLALVLALARYYHRLPPAFLNTPMSVGWPALMILLPVGLVMLQPDLGTAVMITLAGILIMFIAGTGLRWFAGGLAAVLALLPIAWGLLHDYQKKRVLIFLNPDSDPLGAGYHLSQSKIAIGSGGFFGKGFLNGTQSHLDYLPETHTDFIFSAMAEEWGMLGGLVVLLLYGVLIHWGYKLAFRASTRFAKLTAMGLSFTLFLYVSINLAMVMGLAPVVGIPLPLMSYGGTAMLTVMILLGLQMAIHRDSPSQGK